MSFVTLNSSSYYSVSQIESQLLFKPYAIVIQNWKLEDRSKPANTDSKA